MTCLNVILPILYFSFSFNSHGNSHLSWEEVKVDERFSANYPSLRGQGTAPFPAVLICPSMSHSVSSIGNFLLAPCTWLCSPTRMKASTVLLGMLYTTMCQKDNVRPQDILCSCQCLPVMTSGELEQGWRWGKRRDPGPLQPALPLSYILPEHVWGLQPKASSYLNKGEAIGKRRTRVSVFRALKRTKCVLTSSFSHFIENLL